MSLHERLTTKELAERAGLKISSFSIYGGDSRLLKYRHYAGGGRGGKTLAWAGSKAFEQLEKVKPGKDANRKNKTIRWALRRMGVPYKRSSQKFWVANAGELDWIYHDAKKAYRSLAKLIHPDHGGSVKAMSEITDAWFIIQKQFKRRIHG